MQRLSVGRVNMAALVLIMTGLGGCTEPEPAPALERRASALTSHRQPPFAGGPIRAVPHGLPPQTPGAKRKPSADELKPYRFEAAADEDLRARQRRYLQAAADQEAALRPLPPQERSRRLAALKRQILGL